MVKNVEELEKELTRPSSRLVEEWGSIEGDLAILGAGGKMGPTLARLALNADRATGMKRDIYAVSRFSSGDTRKKLDEAGIKTISADILDDGALRSVPDVPNVVYMVGRKFGTEGNEHLTWALNAYLPGRMAERFRSSRIVVFSTGNVYPLTCAADGGASEFLAPEPVGEYAQSCLGRERIFEYFSRRNGTAMIFVRLNYAIDMRYGVLPELARSVATGSPVDLTTGNVNCIWQGDANEIALRALSRCASPPEVVNVTGPETISIRYVANEFGRRFGMEPKFIGEESSRSLLSNAAKMARLFGYPRVSLLQMIEWIAEWIETGGPSWNKPTHFQERSGRF